MEPAQANEYAGLRQTGCEAANDFVRAEYEGLYRWFLWLTRDPERAADLTQETCASFFHSIRRTVPETTPRVWLYAIGRNVWRKHCRKRQRQRKEESDVVLDELGEESPSPHYKVELHEFAQALTGVVALLEPPYREVFTLRVWQELDYEDIAAIQGISRDLARWRFFKARQLVRAQLDSWQRQEEHHGS
ncbi:MAG TPA: RNA polymerase sigma factor [Pirellulales bacterium]